MRARIVMIRGRSQAAISSTINRFCQSRHLGDYSCMAAAPPSNFMLGQRDFQMLSLRKLTSASPAITVANGRFTTNGFRVRGCGFDSHPNASWKYADLKNDCGSNNGIQKERVRAPCIPRSVRVSDQVVREVKAGPSAVNGNGVARKGNFPGVSDQSLPEKVMLAVDVDEVLGNFVSALNQFILDRYSLKCSVSDYHVYEFFKIWNCSRDEADIRVHEFFKTPYFKNGIHPIPGAQNALQRLSEIFNLSIVTSRQNVIKDHTIGWVEKYYPGLFQEIHFGNHFAMEGQSWSKSDICKSLGAKVLIDDNPRYAIECAEVGIKVLLFDYLNSYPWCKTECKHPLVTKVHNWDEVEDHLSLAVVP